MKKYFIKYLPVEGEIKHGDLVYDTVNPNFRIELFVCRIDGDVLYDERGFVRNKEHCKPVKLFVCCQDIKIGQLFYHSSDLLTSILVTDTNIDHLRSRIEHEKETRNNKIDYFFTVMGQISPEAIWVKEGDEFEEDEIKLVNRDFYKCICVEKLGYEDELCPHYNGGVNKHVDGCYRKEQIPWVYKIKCGMCKTFH